MQLPPRLQLRHSAAHQAGMIAIALACILLAVPRAADASSLTLQVQGTSPSGVLLGWRGQTGARYYQVLRGNRVVARVSKRSRSFLDTGLAPATPYRYRVRAVTRSRRLQTPLTPAVTKPSAACDKYALPSGSDSAPGTVTRPVRTIGRLAAITGAGRVGCATGTFTEAVSIMSGGSKGKPLTLRPAPGTTARINGRIWVARSASDVVISGFALVGTNSAELPSPTVNGNRVRIINNDITTNHSGICVLLGSIRGYGTAEDSVLDSNRIHNCGELPANNHQHGIYIESARRALITNNVIVNNADRGIQLYPDARSSWIARNVIHANGQGIIFSGAEGYASSGNTVVDNIITGAKLRSNIEHYWPSNNPIGTGNTAERNCVHGASQDNIVTPVVGYRSSRNTTRDPEYVRPSAGDYRLRSTSPCWHAVPMQSVLR